VIDDQAMTVGCFLLALRNGSWRNILEGRLCHIRKSIGQAFDLAEQRADEEGDRPDRSLGQGQ
jgi:hypothetical protein